MNIKGLISWLVAENHKKTDCCWCTDIVNTTSSLSLSFIYCYLRTFSLSILVDDAPENSASLTLFLFSLLHSSELSQLLHACAASLPSIFVLRILTVNHSLVWSDTCPHCVVFPIEPLCSLFCNSRGKAHLLCAPSSLRGCWIKAAL